MATVNSIATSVIKEFGKSTDDPGLVLIVEGYVNDGLDEIAIATDWNHFRATAPLNTSIGEPHYLLPQGGREIIQLRLTDTGEPISKWTIQEAARRGIKVDEPGRPAMWLEAGVLTQGVNVLYRFRLIPEPNVVVEIEQEYLFHPGDVPSGTVFPVQDQLIGPTKHYVRAAMAMRYQRYDKADRHQRLFETDLAKLVKKENNLIADHSVMKATDILNVGRGRPTALLPPDHYRNKW